MAFKQVILIRTDLGMKKGKIAVQAGHAIIEAFLKTQNKHSDYVDKWLSEGQQKVILKVANEKELLEYFMKLKNLFPCALIKDAGRTQIAPGSTTAMGIGPVPENEIDKFISKLKLL